VEKRRFLYGCFFGIVLSVSLIAAVPAQTDTSAQQDISVWKKHVPLINEADLFCSFSIIEQDLEARITAVERSDGRMLLREGDIVFFDLGISDGVEVGQVYQMIEIGEDIGGFGLLALKRGWIRVQKVMDTQSRAEIERLCGEVEVGTRIAPFEELEVIDGKDLGYDVEYEDLKGPDGEFLYFQQEYVQLSKNNWAVINLGAEDGIKKAQQLIVYRLADKNTPVVLANIIVVDVQPQTSTIKVLSCRDIIKDGDLIKGR